MMHKICKQYEARTNEVYSVDTFIQDFLPYLIKKYSRENRKKKLRQ